MTKQLKAYAIFLAIFFTLLVPFTFELAREYYLEITQSWLLMCAITLIPVNRSFDLLKALFISVVPITLSFSFCALIIHQMKDPSTAIEVEMSWPALIGVAVYLMFASSVAGKIVKLFTGIDLWSSRTPHNKIERIDN